MKSWSISLLSKWPKKLTGNFLDALTASMMWSHHNFGRPLFQKPCCGAYYILEQRSSLCLLLVLKDSVSTSALPIPPQHTSHVLTPPLPLSWPMSCSHARWYGHRRDPFLLQWIHSDVLSLGVRAAWKSSDVVFPRHYHIGKVSCTSWTDVPPSLNTDIYFCHILRVETWYVQIVKLHKNTFFSFPIPSGWILKL